MANFLESLVMRNKDFFFVLVIVYSVTLKQKLS